MRHKYAEAEPLYKRELAILEMTLGPADSKLSPCLNNLASLLYFEAKYAGI